MEKIKQKIVLSDEPELIKLIESSFFGREGYELKKVSSGPEAFRSIEEEAPVLAILSLNMAEFGGEECFRRVKNDPFLCLLPVMLICSNSPQELKKCRNAGCDNIIIRPIDSWDLISMACRLLNIVGRASPRCRVSIPVHWGPQGDDIQSGTIVDLNSGGIFINTDIFLPPGKNISLRFLLPNRDKVICCQGKVAWINHPEWVKSTALPAGMGICFTSIPEPDMTSIQMFLQKENG